MFKTSPAFSLLWLARAWSGAVPQSNDIEPPQDLVLLLGSVCSSHLLRGVCLERHHATVDRVKAIHPSFSTRTCRAARFGSEPEGEI
jgi:hypothetical protein